MPVNPNGYPLDLTGVEPANLIPDELRVFTTAQSRYFVPSAGPFYTEDLILRHGTTNAILQPMTDYIVLHLHRLASRISRKEVCAIIWVKNTNIPSVKVRYHAIGGIYGETADVIRALLDSVDLNSRPAVAWGDILGIPYQFNPAEHLHHGDEIYGLGQLVSELEQIRVAILAGDSGAFNAVYQYIDNFLTNQNYVTQEQLDYILDLVPFIQVKVVKTNAELRTLTTMANNTASLYVSTGQNSFLDGRGRSFIWDITCTLPDDNDRVIRPTSIPALNAGRFVVHERNIQDIDATNAYIDAFIDNVNVRLINAGVAVAFANSIHTDSDLNTLVDTHVWHVSDIAPNRPFDHGTLVVQRWYDTPTYNDVKQTMEGPDGRYAVRYGYKLLASDPWTWLSWVSRNAHGDGAQTFNAQAGGDPTHVVNNASLATAFASLWTRLTHAGIDADLAVTNSVNGTNLDTILLPGEYYYGISSANRPSNYGLLKVWREDSVIVYQVALSSERTLHWRYRNGLGVWEDWETAATQNWVKELVLISHGAATNIAAVIGDAGNVGGITRSFSYTTQANDSIIKIKIISAGGGGGSGGGTANNDDEDAGAQGGTGAASGCGTLIEFDARCFPVGTVIGGYVGKGGDRSGSTASAGAQADGAEITIWHGSYPHPIFNAYFPGGYGGNLGNHNTGEGTPGGVAGPAAQQPDIRRTSMGIRYTAINGSKGGDSPAHFPGQADGSVGGDGGHPTPLQGVQSHYDRRAHGGAAGLRYGGGSVNGGEGESGNSVYTHPYDLGKGGGGGGGAARGAASGGLGGPGGPGGFVIEVTRI